MRHFLYRFRWLGIAIIAFIFGVIVFSATATSNKNFIRGQYGKKCYMVGSEHGNIKYPIYFETLDECLKSLGPQKPPDLHIEKL